MTAMPKLDVSTKRIAISKANAQMVAAVSIASFITVFCLIAAKNVWSQTAYQARVSAKDAQAYQQLQKNVQAFNDLAQSYKKFNSDPTNIIGGSSTGNGKNAGENAKVILDALPDKYDFPALTSSIEKILTSGKFNVTGISGTDEQLSQQNNTSSPNPQPVNMPFSFTVSNANYTSVQQLITVLQNSIRPIQIDTIDLTGGTSNMTLTVKAHTYFQPGKKVTITKQEVR